MKIFFITATLTSGGSERVMSLLANELVSRGYDITIISLKEKIVFYSLDKRVKLLFASDFSNNIFLKIYWLRKNILSNKPNVIIPFMTKVYCMTIFSLIGVKIPIISSERIDPRYSSFMSSLLRNIFLRYTEHLVVQTNNIKEFYSEKMQKRITVIPNPIVDEVFIKRDLPIKIEQRIISVARLFPQKNQGMMIEAFSKISQKYPNYKLYIYGEGPSREYLENLIKKNNLIDKVFLPGRTNNIILELCRSEIFCLSSNYEGMSNAMLEALCVGLPIVTTNVSGVEDLVQNGKTGFVVSVNDRQDFAEKLCLLLDNSNLRLKFREENLKKSYQFKLGRIADLWENLIKNIVNNYDA